MSASDDGVPDVEPNRIDQVAIAVPDLDAAIALWQGVFGARLERREVVGSDAVEEAMLKVGDGYLQLIAPTTPDSTVQRFLDRQGPGLHHVGLAVTDVAAALDELRRAGVRLIDEQPRPGGGGHRVAFVHPKGTGGVLVELIEDRPDGDGPPAEASG